MSANPVPPPQPVPVVRSLAGAYRRAAVAHLQIAVQLDKLSLPGAAEHRRIADRCAAAEARIDSLADEASP